MYNLKLYSENPSIFQKYISLTNQKQILIERICKKILEKNTSKKLKLLDIGCADGTVTTQIIERIGKSYQLEITGIETSTELINDFKLRTNYDINFINKNVESLDKLPESDFILIAHVVSYIEDLEKFIDKVINSLNARGIALIVVSNDYSDDKKVKDSLKRQNSKDTRSTNIKKILSKMKAKYEVEVVESDIDISGIKNMNEKGKTIVEFLKHKKFEDISADEINDIRNIILNIADGNKKIIKREDYIWILKE